LIVAEDYSRWQCLWDQLDLILARLELLEKHKISSVEVLLQVKAIIHDIEAAQSFVRVTADNVEEIASPRITELQEKISLSLANLEIVARKLKEIPGAPGPLSVDSMKGFRQEILQGKEELKTVVTAAFQRLKLK
jgi:hypothetical protein